MAADSNPGTTDLDLDVLRLLVANEGRVVGREYLARESGIGASSARRIDTCLVSLRRVLGSGCLLTVRRRGWMLTTAGLALAAELLQSLPS